MTENINEMMFDNNVLDNKMKKRFVYIYHKIPSLSHILGEKIDKF